MGKSDKVGLRRSSRAGLWVAAIASVLLIPTSAGADSAGSGVPSEPQTAQSRVAVTKRQVGRAPAISAAGLKLARETKNDKNYKRLPAEVQRYLSAPVSQTDVEITIPVVLNETGLAGSSGSGQVGTGCWNTTVKRSSSNIFGAVLYRAETSALNWCRNSTRITNTPTSYRYTNSHWGWGQCGWHNTYEGFLSGTFRWGVGGVARFALADSCFAAQAQLSNEVQVQGDGKWFTWTN